MPHHREGQSLGSGDVWLVILVLFRVFALLPDEASKAAGSASLEEIFPVIRDPGEVGAVEFPGI